VQGTPSVDLSLGLGFKRNFVVPGVLITAFEVTLVLWPLLLLFHIRPEQSHLMLRASLPVLVGVHVIWFAALASWLAPVQKAITLRRKHKPLDARTAEDAYRALSRVPLRALWLRTLLWIAVAVAYGVLLSTYSDFPRAQIGTLASVVGLYAFAAAILRAAWYARILGRLRQPLFPDIAPLKQFYDRYFHRLMLVSMLVGGGTLAALASFIYYFLPIKEEEYLQVQTFLPGAILLLTLGWVAYARWLRRPIDKYLKAQIQPGQQSYDPTPDPRVIAAFGAAQWLPYRLAASRAAAWVLATAVVSVVARSVYHMEFDNSVLMFGAAVIIVVGSTLYEAIWHRETMRPLLKHISVRHRLPIRDLRAALSLRTKMLISFGGLVLFACGLSLFWGFVQYKTLATTFVQTQAGLRLNGILSEVLRRAGEAGVTPSARLVTEVVKEAGVSSAADGAVFYYVPEALGAAPLGYGGGNVGVPRLPWFAAARVRGSERGKLDSTSMRLSGHYMRLQVSWQGQKVALGSVASLYPGYRGRGPGIQRPLTELLVFFLVLFGVCAGIVVLTVGEFTTPIRQLEQRADEMARGELSRPVSTGGEADEVGRLTFAVEEMRRALREKLRSTEEVNLDLEREVQRRTADLAKKNRELADALDQLTRAQSQLVRAEKMASIGQLVAGIAHEINNPVNAIVNTVAPLSDIVEEIAVKEKEAKGQAANADELRDMVRVIQRGARRTKEIVQALHNYSRTDDERVVEFDLNRSLDDSLELLRHHLKGHITVERTYGDVGKIKGHAGQLNQVFMNLLTNAAQALSSREGARIELVTARTDKAVVISVIDNGPGIAPEVVPKIFDPFFTTKEVGQGTGLGLSIVHGIVERHSGTIEVDSEVGKGTRFTVTLPVETVRQGAA
jgi:signal transduction histidine kinase